MKEICKCPSNDNRKLIRYNENRGFMLYTEKDLSVSHIGVIGLPDHHTIPFEIPIKFCPFCGQQPTIFTNEECNCKCAQFEHAYGNTYTYCSNNERLKARWFDHFKERPSEYDCMNCEFYEPKQIVDVNLKNSNEVKCKQ